MNIRRKSSPKWGLIIGSFAVVLAIAGGGWLWLNRLPAVIDPVTKKASTNAFDYYVAAGNAIQDEEKIKSGFQVTTPAMPGTVPTSGSALSTSEKEAIVKNNRLALRLLRRGFDFEYQERSARSISEPSPWFVKFRTLSRLLVLEGQAKSGGGDWKGATDSYLDAMRLGADVPRGGAVISQLVGVAIENATRRDLWPAVDVLDTAEARTAAARMEGILARQVSYADTLKGEERVLLATVSDMLKGKLDTESASLLGLPPDVPMKIAQLPQQFKQKMLDDLAKFMDGLAANARQPYAIERSVFPNTRIARNQLSNMGIALVTKSAPLYDKARFVALRCEAQNALLTVMLALRAYNEEHKAYPKALTELVPPYLKKVPSDPFAARGPLRYKPKGAYYVLYSVGPDCRDDGGTALPVTPQGPIAELGAAGDIVAGINK